ncbi:MAG: PIG-L family deacetylase [Chloroflexi bacterium]|nr:PIG-L family deacetylase [Chloroflexota bacterium]MCC6896597.1 PIG-L family deacetylase [Anaerolineae bacterium]
MSPRLLCVFAHPDDEVFCAGGTIAKYVASGAQVMVVSATKGDAGQIRDARIATRRTLGTVRAAELQTSCQQLGAQVASCLDYGDGTLKDMDINILVEHVTKIIREFKPDVVITFGPDGAYGHPDHIVIGEAVTIACTLASNSDNFPAQIASGLKSHSPAYLYHSYFPKNSVLMLSKLSNWLVHSQETEAYRKYEPAEFARALLLFAEETTLLHYANDRIDVSWYPSGFYIIEQGEVAKDLYLILSGHAEIIKEAADGTLQVVKKVGAGTFFGEQGLARQQPRNAHVVALDDVTCLVMSTSDAIAFGGRGSNAVLVAGADRSAAHDLLPVDTGSATHCIDVTAHIAQKIAAMSAHRSQYPIVADMFPLDLLESLMGREYFVRVLPRPELQDSLFPYRIRLKEIG